jgi:chromate transporter
MLQISMVQRKLVEKDKVIDNASVLDGISLGSILPGPMAANVVTYIGYRLNGIRGAFAASIGVILPSFILMLGLSYLYFKYGDLPEAGSILKGIMPAVCAIIFSVAINLARKNIRAAWQWIVVLISLILLIFIGGFYTTVGIILAAGITGIFLSTKSIPEGEKNNTVHPPLYEASSPGYKAIIYPAAILILITLIYFIPFLGVFSVSEEARKIHDIFFRIGTVSLTLFGGGYVFIPALGELFVDQLHWVSQKEFVDGIALGQMTPGPIMISAAFIGYKVAGFWGALAGTLAIFGPPAVLMIVAARFVMHFKDYPSVKAAFKGIHAAVIGMILAAVIIIGNTMEIDWPGLCIFASVFALVTWFKIDLAPVLLAAGLAGYFLF